MSGLAHFPPETLRFLAGIAAHNDKIWFDANRPLYEAGFVEPVKAERQLNPPFSSET